MDISSIMTDCSFPVGKSQLKSQSSLPKKLLWTEWQALDRCTHGCNRMYDMRVGMCLKCSETNSPFCIRNESDSGALRCIRMIHLLQSDSQIGGHSDDNCRDEKCKFPLNCSRGSKSADQGKSNKSTIFSNSIKFRRGVIPLCHKEKKS